MKKSSVGENAKRVMAKAMLDEVLQMIESKGENALRPDELIEYLQKFAAEPPTDKLEQIRSDLTAAQETKDRFWAGGDIVCEKFSITMRRVNANDQTGFLQLQQEYSSVRSLLADEAYRLELWSEHIESSALMLSITHEEQYIGYCGINDTSKTPWEIVIELLPEWTHRGIGYAAISAMANAIETRLGVSDFRVRIDPTNTASQRLFEKLGAKPNGISEFILHDAEEIRQCEELNLPLIDDALVAVAQKFNVEPRKLLSHVLEYKLSIKKHPQGGQL